jgi:hypothetical protein
MKLQIIIVLVFIKFIFFACSENSQNQMKSTVTNNENSLKSKSKINEDNPKLDEKDEKKLTIDERVEQIREWYAEIQKIGMQNCKTIKKTRYEIGLDPEGGKMPFEQVVKTCQLDENYELIRGEFTSYEAGYKLSVYKKEGKVFFVFIEGGAEAWSYEHRFYFDTDEKLIRKLQREADGGEQISGPNKEVKIKPGVFGVNESLKDWLADLEFVTGKKL